MSRTRGKEPFHCHQLVLEERLSEALRDVVLAGATERCHSEIEIQESLAGSAEADCTVLGDRDLVFWNVNSRSGTIPVKENNLGVALVSGFSPNIAKMVMSGQTDPYDCLLEAINAERYQQVDDALRPIISA